MEQTSEIAAVRRIFPITDDFIYLNHAGTGPLPTPARHAIEECLGVYQGRGQFTIEEYFSRLQDARCTIARFINARPEEITFTHNTSEGLYIALVNLPLKPGDEILVMDEVFPAARYVVKYNLPGIEKRFIRFSGQDSISVIEKNLTSRTRAVVLDYVQFLNGEMVDLKSLCPYLLEKGIYLVVDGIQAIGAVNFDVKKIPVDFLACGSAKWLFRPPGTGFLYVNSRNFKILNRFHTGWLGADWGDFEHFDTEPELFPDARMFEPGTRNMPGISALKENIKLLLEFGMERVEKRVLYLKELLHQGFLELGYKIITPSKGPQSGIITIKPDRAGVIYEKLKKRKVVISLRNGCLRFSPHFYNTEEEIEQVLCLLKG